MTKFDLLLTLCILLVSSCSTIKTNEFEGTFVHKRDISKGKLIFKDSTFEYGYDVPMLSHRSKGIWERTGNVLILNSYKEFDTGIINVEEINDNRSHIKVINTENWPLPYIFIRLNDSIDFETDSNGIVYLSDIQYKEIKEIDVGSAFLGIGGGIHFPTGNFNSFIITIVEKDYNKMYFENAEVKILNNNSLIFGEKKYNRVKN